MIAYLLIIAIAFSVVAVSLIQLVGDYLFSQQVRDDQRIAENIAAAVEGDYLSRDAEAIYNSAWGYIAEGVSRVLVLDRYGVVQVDTDSQLNGSRFDNPEAAGTLASGRSTGNIYQTDAHSSWAEYALGSISSVDLMTGIYAAAITGEAGVIGAIVYISQAEEIYEGLRSIRIKIILWLAVIAILALVMSMFVVRTITNPIRELNEGISRMARGDLSSRVKVHGKNEFARLAMAFNSMSERIELFDKSRNQFVSNASHELKTPLSTMKILIETLLYQDTYNAEMQKEFLGDVNKEIDRLSGIISDLLTLVHIDSGGMQIKPAELRLSTLVQEQTQRLMPLAREQGISMDCVVKDPCETFGDETKLQQAFYNVIDNAIKYTPRGGEVSIEVLKSGKKCVVRVTDTGVGIPESDLPHIFDRFYRVDRARSRETGGTGLGLSIVKQILLLHGGDISAMSREGAGTTFTMELPVLPRKE
ncbi:MAG: ATP-binding protein [Christensenellales bacterium]|jgi:two-component system OmpR family sensor kinase